MKSKIILKRSFSLFVLCFFAIISSAQQKDRNTGFVPHVGQAGKDVIWVPTPEVLVSKMLEIAKVTPEDVVVDLGSGDGRTVIAAAKMNASATGVEFNPDMVALSRKNAEEAGVSAKAKFVQADLFDYDFSNATVITMFLLPEINLRLRPKILDMKPGTRIVSNSFTMGEWKPDLEITLDESSSWNTALMWIVPAKLQGTWKLPNGELTVDQEFQKFYGTFVVDGKNTPVSEGKIEGSSVSFRIGSAVYTGKVGDNSMTGTVKDGNNTSDWAATKTK